MKVQPGSGEEYGEIYENELPINEKTVLRPVNPYAVTKIAQDLIGYVYFKSYDTQVYRCRTFNHEGPRREKVFGISSYAYQIAKIEAGLQDPTILVGHLKDKRNFTHVKDICHGLIAMGNGPCEGEIFNLGTGKNYSIIEIEESKTIKSYFKNSINKQVVNA